MSERKDSLDVPRSYFLHVGRARGRSQRRLPPIRPDVGRIFGRTLTSFEIGAAVGPPRWAPVCPGLVLIGLFLKETPPQQFGVGRRQAIQDLLNQNGRQHTILMTWIHIVGRGLLLEEPSSPSLSYPTGGRRFLETTDEQGEPITNGLVSRLLEAGKEQVEVLDQILGVRQREAESQRIG